MRRPKLPPVRRSMCATCPFRAGSRYSYLAPDLAASALGEASRICHSTGANNAINARTGKAPRLCRGARDVQIEFYAAIGFIDAATDEAWARKVRELTATERIET